MYACMCVWRETMAAHKSSAMRKVFSYNDCHLNIFFADLILWWLPLRGISVLLLK